MDGLTLLTAIAAILFFGLVIRTHLRLFKDLLNMRFELHDESLEISQAPSKLRLLCVLVEDPDGSYFFKPVTTMHRMPPLVSVKGQWALAPDTGLTLRETHAKQAAPSVLERCLRQRQTNAFRSYSGTLRSGGVAHA